MSATTDTPTVSADTNPEWERICHAVPVLVPVSAPLAVVEPLWWALRSDIRLAGTARPSYNTDFAALQAEKQFDMLVSLVENNLYDCSPLQHYEFPLEDLYGGARPSDSSAEVDRLINAVAKVRALLDQRRGVLVHCEGGTGRTGAVIGSVLVSYGTPPDEVAGWLDEVHRLRGKPGWPESSWQRDALLTLATKKGQPSPFAPPGTRR